MNSEESTYDLISRYLSGYVTVAERAEVEQRLQTDAGFKQYFEAHQAAHSLILVKEELNLRSQMQAIHLEASAEANRYSRSFIAAVILLIGLILLWAVWAFWPSKPAMCEGDIPAVSQESVENSIPAVEEVMTTGIAVETMSHDEEQVNTQTTTAQAQDTQSDSEDSSRGKGDNPLETISPNPLKPIPNQGDGRKDKLGLGTDRLTDQPSAPPCSSYDASLVFEISPSCINKRHGAIAIVNQDHRDLRGYSLNSGPQQASPAFSSLPPGEYDLRVYDSKGCPSNTLLIEVPSYVCEHVVYPAQNRNWEIDCSRFTDDIVHLEIYNSRSGALVYSRDMETGADHKWDGRSTSGDALGMGSYTYVMSGATHVERGMVSVVR